MEFRYYRNEITRYVSFFSHSQFSVLEIGCGPGHLIGTIPGTRKTGIDMDEAALARARKLFPEVTFLKMDAHDMATDATFDLVILSNLIGELHDVQQVFGQLRKVCHRRTKIIVTYYNYLWEPVLKFGEWIGIRKPKPAQNWLSRKDIKNLLYLAGFETYRETSGVLLPIHVPLLSWFFNSLLSKLPLLRNFCVNNYSFARIVNVIDEKLKDILPSVSVIIPARNESGNIENAILRMPLMGANTQVIFVEGHSSDNTWKIIQEVKAKYSHLFPIEAVRQDGKGKNDAVQKGFDMATGDILMILDADLTVQPEELSRFYDAIVQNKADFINGCRLVYQMDKQAMRLLNLFGNKIFCMIFSWLLDQPVKDTLCGTKVMWHSDYLLLNQNRSYFGNFDPFGDFDLLFGACKLNLKIIDMPIHYRERTYGTTNISRFRHGLILFRMCWTGARKIKFI